jgi:hypothetical protein
MPNLRFNQLQIEHIMTEQDAIRKLKYLQNQDEGANVHISADAILCDFLDAAGHVEIAREFRKIHEIYPTATPRYSKPSWRQSGLEIRIQEASRHSQDLRPGAPQS